MEKAKISQHLEEMATLLELKGENPFKVRAYQNAARSIETWGGTPSDLQDPETLAKIPGVGKAISGNIMEMAVHGSLKFLEELRQEFPADILELYSLPGLGAKKVKALYEQLKVASISQLLEACEAGRVAELPGFGKTTQVKLIKAISARTQHVGSFQLGQIAAEAERLREDLRALPETLQVAIAGSYRRRKEVVRDLDFIVASSDAGAVTKSFVEHPLVQTVLAQGPTKSSVQLQSGIQCDLRVVASVEYPFALNYFTGSKEHNIVMRNRALSRGWTPNEYRLAPVPVAPETAAGESEVSTPKGRRSRSAPPAEIPEVADEAELYEALGLVYIPAELRENCGEFEAAAKGALPDLIEPQNLRGTFHCHTTASDGHNTLEEMTVAAQALGLQYLGIADHSRSLVQAHGLDLVQLRAQMAAIGRMNQELDGFRLFSGVECDILRNGDLDYDDETLAQLDYVVASVHSGFGLPEAEMTERIIRAVSNPYVTMLAHPTGRLLLRREPYAVDIPAVIEAAAETGTWIEINAAPKRLDLDWRWWPLAKEKGVKCVINPDAHRTERLQDLWFGVGIARKGWLTREDVVNCLPLGEIDIEMKRKRGESRS